LRAFSFTIARPAWVRTVAGLNESSRAICSLVRPVVTQATISRSRSVSVSMPVTTPPGWLNSDTTRRVTDGDSNASPAATTRIARTRSAGAVSLSTKPAAPACRASNTYRSISKVVTTITRRPARSGSAAIARNVARPSMPGIRTSRSSTSGRT